MNLASRYHKIDSVNGIQLYRKKGNINSFLILFTNQPDFKRFAYFINYIRCPEGFKHFKPFLSGYYKTTDIQGNHSYKKGNWLMVFVDKSDNKYDNVTLVNESNETYIYSFNRSPKKDINATNIFKQIVFNIENYNHVIDIIPDEKLKKLKINGSNFGKKTECLK